MPRPTRRSLKPLQHTATDRENLVGRTSKNLKHQLSQEPLRDVEVKRKHVSSNEKEIQVSSNEKATQVNFDNQISPDDLVNPDGASQKYWKILAKKRQQALQEALEENEKLKQMIEDLKEERNQYRQMLDEANSFVEVIKEELAFTSKDDTGIDVNDVSTADETQDEDNTVEDPSDN